ncbi:SpoIIE family protein phosphatase [Streptomyces sp. NPDC055400]
MGSLSAPVLRAGRFAFAAGDCLVLYTDGVIEARSRAGAFYPLAERVASFPVAGPDSLLRHIHRDLLAHTGGQLNDDIALLVIERTPTRQPPHPHLDGRPARNGPMSGPTRRRRPRQRSRRPHRTFCQVAL